MERSIRGWTDAITQIDKNYSIHSQQLSSLVENLFKDENLDISSIHETSQELISNLTDYLFELDTQVSGIEGCEIRFSSPSVVIESLKETLKSIQVLSEVMEAHLRVLIRRLSFGAEIEGRELDLKNSLNGYQKSHNKLLSDIEILLDELQGFISESEDLRHKKIL